MEKLGENGGWGIGGWEVLKRTYRCTLLGARCANKAHQRR